MSKERPIDTIRRMNPGKWIPTGAELAAFLAGDDPPPDNTPPATGYDQLKRKPSKDQKEDEPPR